MSSPASGQAHRGDCRSRCWCGVGSRLGSADGGSSDDRLPQPTTWRPKASSCHPMSSTRTSRWTTVDRSTSFHAARVSRSCCLHGVCLNSGIWAHQLSDLSDEIRVIALDLRGHGQSVTGSDGFLLNLGGGGGTATSPEDPVGDLLAERAARGLTAKGMSTKGMTTKGMTRRTGAGRARRIRRMAPPALERLALDVRQVLRALDVEGAVLVGHSMGGMVAVQAVAGMSPEERQPQVVRTGAHEHDHGAVSGLARLGPVRVGRLAGGAASAAG